MSASPAPLAPCSCTRDKYGPVYCDAHRPAPPPDPVGACIFCHRLEPEGNLVEYRYGKFHPRCAED
jgi:hypothetical protein